MAEAEFPPEVARFLGDHIASVAQLEILIFMHARAAEELPPDVVARELRIDVAWAAAELRHLAESGMLAERTGPTPVYRFAPRTPELRARGPGGHRDVGRPPSPSLSPS